LKHKNICCWDLEGPISVIDFAAEMGRLLRDKPELNLKNYDMGEFFSMISNYDDYLIDFPGIKEKLKIPEYQPGDTLRLMAPFYVYCFSDKELTTLVKQNLGLLPGSKDLMRFLRKNWEIFVISTSYTPFARIVTSALNIPQDHVYCTDFQIKKLKEGLGSLEVAANVLIKKIFQKYLNNNKELESVIDELNDFFWKEPISNYIKIMNQVKVRGGKGKESAVEEISKWTKIPISEMIALGDSITDIDMLKRLNDEKGIAISFNGNKFSVKYANIAITSINNLGVLPVFEAKNNREKFLEKWESEFETFQYDPKKISNELISKECKSFFIKHNFVPEIVSLTNKSEAEIKEVISRQEKMRKLVRGWAGNLG
jgi:energy-converting hydrogenase A subunit R